MHIGSFEPKRYSCSGTPADCIIFGMSQILDKPPDLVLTGINHGMNVADDILYSGTVAGAMEAALLQVPAIAMSQRRVLAVNHVVELVAPWLLVRRLLTPHEVCRSAGDRGQFFS